MRSQRRDALVLARGLAVGLGAIALVVAALAVFGGDRGGGTRAVAEARTVEEIGRVQAARRGSTDGTTSPGASATVGAVSGTQAAAGTASTTAPPPVGAAAGPVVGGPAAPATGAVTPGAIPATPAPEAPTPPASSPPPVYNPWASVAPGPGGAVTVTLGGFPPNTGVSIACYHIIIGQGPAQFSSYPATTDGSGASTTSSCVWSQPDTHVYVLVSAPGIAGPVGSNHYQFPA